MGWFTYPVVEFAEELVAVLRSSSIMILGEEAVRGKGQGSVCRLGRVDGCQDQLAKGGTKFSRVIPSKQMPI